MAPGGSKYDQASLVVYVCMYMYAWLYVCCGHQMTENTLTI